MVPTNKLMYRLSSNCRINGRKSIIAKSPSKILPMGKLSEINIGFSSNSYSVMENAGTVVIYVERSGDTEQAISVAYFCEDGAARSGVEYNAVKGRLIFDDNTHKK